MYEKNGTGLKGNDRKENEYPDRNQRDVPIPDFIPADGFLMTEGDLMKAVNAGIRDRQEGRRRDVFEAIRDLNQFIRQNADVRKNEKGYTAPLRRADCRDYNNPYAFRRMLAEEAMQYGNDCTNYECFMEASAENDLVNQIHFLSERYRPEDDPCYHCSDNGRDIGPVPLLFLSNIRHVLENDLMLYDYVTVSRGFNNSLPLQFLITDTYLIFFSVRKSRNAVDILRVLNYSSVYGDLLEWISEGGFHRRYPILAKRDCRRFYL